MNILYIHTHDSGRYIQPYGYPVPTPNLMNLAEEGVLFRQAYCAGPTCSPSRAGLLTGMAPHSCGMTGLAHLGFKLNDYNQHLVNFLNGQGYETVLCGIQHEAPDSGMIGYRKILNAGDDTKFNSKSGPDWDISNAKRVVEYLKEKKDRPFFLSFGMFNTHRPYPENDGSVNPGYVMPPFPIYDSRESREDMAQYCVSAKIADQCVGIVMEGLEQSGLAQDTLVIFTTDHGIAFPKMKCTLYDTGIGVSLIMKMPGCGKKGIQIDSLVSQVDVFPTICDMIHADHPEGLQGRSLLPLLTGEADRTRDEIFSEVTFHVNYEPMRCVRTERYKLIKFFDSYSNIAYANIDDSLSKEFLLKSGYLNCKREKDMLFDLYFDPVERVNLIENEEYREIHEDLSKRLEAWMRETGDPLLKGKIRKPEGAVVKKLTCISPKDQEIE